MGALGNAVVADCELTEGVRLTGYTDLRYLGPTYAADCPTVRGRMMMMKTTLIIPTEPPEPWNISGVNDFQVFSSKMFNGTGRDAQTFVTLETPDGDLHITGVIQFDGSIWVFLNRMPSLDLEVTVSWTVIPVNVAVPVPDGGGSEAA